MILERCKHGLCRNCIHCHYLNQIERLNAENVDLKRQLEQGLPKAPDATAQPNEVGADTGLTKRGRQGLSLISEEE